MSVVANVAINVDSRDAVGKLRQVQAQSQATERAVGGLGSAIGKLAIAAAALQAGKFIFAKTAELESQARSLQVLTGSAQKAAQIIQQLKQLGAVTPFTSSELIDAAKRLQAFGVSADQVVETTKRLADVSGATGAELQGLVTAYGQVQAKGRLQGEELLQFQERGVALQEELRKMYGLSGEEFQKALEKGRISAAAVEVAVQRLTSAGGKYANGAIAQSDTLAGKFSTLQDGIESIASTIGTALSPAIKAVLNEAIFAVNAINDLIATGARARSFGLGQQQRQQILKQAESEAAQIVNSRRLADPFERNKQFLEIRRQREKDLIESYGYQTGQIKPPAARPTRMAPPPPLLGGGGAGGGGGGGRTGASEAEQAAKRLAEEIKRSFEEGQNLTREFERQKALLSASTDFDRRRLQIQFEYQDNVRKIAELKNAEQAIAATILNREIRKLEILKLQREEQEAIRDALESAFKDMPAAGTGKEDAFRAIFDQRIPDAIQESKDRLKELTDPVNQIIGAATAIGDAFAESFRGVVSGSMTAQQALASFFQSVANYFIDMAAQIAAEAIKLQAIQILQSLLKPLLSGGFGVAGPGMDIPGLGGAGALGGAPITPGGVFAEGGFVTGPTNALIGEGGQPEYVIPASKMRSAMGRYAAGARGASVIPSAGNDGGPTQPGGIAASPIDVRYTVERINSVDYVTADQFQVGMRQAAAQGAQRGEQRALRSLQQSTAVRSRVGMR